MRNTPSKKKQKSNSGFRKFIFILWVLLLSPFAGIALLLFIASNKDLPNTQTLANPKTDLATEVLTEDGLVIGRYYRENRSDVKAENIPPHMVKALIATEDARFYDHSGVDFFGLIRAIAYMGSRGGGSTLTQQLAKMLFTKDFYNIPWWERALLQKPKEWIIATRLEKQYTKEEIITLYLNRYDFLNQAVGVKSAAHIYFNKATDSLRVEESAMLIGMLKNSALYNPLRREEMVKQRREVVLHQMLKYDYLDEAAYDSLRQTPLGLNFQRVSHDEGMAPYFREILRARLKDILNEKDENGSYVRHKEDGSQYDIYGDGLKIYSTLNASMQAYGEWAVEQHLATELQAQFEKDLKKRNKSNYPFYDGILANDKQRILAHSMRESERYQMLTGKLCPDCHRPAFYIVKSKHDGHDYFTCDPEKGGCSFEWQARSEKEIEAIFQEKSAMKVYSHKGDIDTLLSPMDSIKYMKTFLHAGLLSMDPHTGHVKAWVGGIDYKHFQYDNVYQSRRQVGSTFKPFVYATALRFGEHPCHEVPNQKICIDMPGDQAPWCPENSDKKYGNMVTLEHALANSTNSVTAFLIKKYGVTPVIQLARDLGIKSDIPAVPSIALGVAELSLYEMVAANAALVNHGIYIEPIFFTRIEDKNGNCIYETPLNINQALDEKTAYLTVSLMKGVVDGAYNREAGKSTGTGMRLRMDLPSRDYDNIRYPMAGKTGTTQGNTDGWFMGLTPDLVTGVWVGAPDAAVRFSTTTYGQGANTALPIYGYYMHKVYDDKKLQISIADFEKPDEPINMELDCIEYNKNANSVNFGGGANSGDNDLFN